jgi:ribulose-bisphosphate carboxylase large chain
MAPDPKQKVRSETNSCVHQHLLPVLDQVGAFRTERQQETGFGFSPHASLSCRHADSLEHPERFWVDYLVEAASEADAHKMARELCLEQTVELPDNLVEVKQVEAYTVGSVERIECLSKSPGHDGEGDHLFRVTVAFPNDTCGDELTQFLNVVFGNTSLKQGIAVEHVTLSRHLSENKSMFPGPKFGIQGLRELLGVPKAPLLCTALKPMGRSSHELAGMAYALAKGGIDIIKDDHGLADQVWAPFEERVTLCSAAVTRANQETGRRCLYSPCLNAPSDKFVERAFYSKKVGAGAVMVLPGITGFDAVRQLAASPEFGLPIIIHPALLGGWLQTGNLSQRSMMPEHHEHPRGFSHEFLFGILPRLCGGDAVIFPNAGGRFQFTPQDCQEVAQGCRRPLGRFEPLLPCPAGNKNQCDRFMSSLSAIVLTHSGSQLVCCRRNEN